MCVCCAPGGGPKHMKRIKYTFQTELTTSKVTGRRLIVHGLIEHGHALVEVVWEVRLARLHLDHAGRCLHHLHSV